MDTQKFMDLSSLEKVEVVNKMLNEQKTDHLKNVAQIVGLAPSTFSKIMRDNSSYQYNQSTKQYDRILSIDEYKKYLATEFNENNIDEALLFISVHLDELKDLLHTNENQLILAPEIYDPNSKTITKSIQFNAAVYEDFNKLLTNHYPHLRLRDVFSQCLLDFSRTYQPKKPPT